jgi:signal transduction histidine kinase
MLITCAGLLALGVVSILRIRDSPLARPLAGLCVVSFVWRFGVWAHSLTSAWSWVSLECTFAPWSVALALHFVLVFVGMRRRMRLTLWLIYAVGAGLSGVAATGFMTEWGQQTVLAAPWNAVLATQMLGCLAVGGSLLVRHLRTYRSAEESMRTKIVLAASAVAVVLLPVALLVPDPHALIVGLMAVGLLLLTAVTFGFRFFESELTGLTAIYIGSLSVIACGGYIVARHALVSSSHLLLLAGLAIVVCLAALVIQAASVIVQHQSRVAHLTALGRWSAYMAHDLRNPLAALKGAAQFLVEERAQGRSIDGQREFLELLVAESDRLSRLVDHYQRFGGYGAVKEAIALNDIVRQILEQQRSLIPASVAVELELQSQLPACALDRELFGVALENLLSNAIEAMPDGGTLTLRTARAERGAETKRVVVSVEDTGRGMSPRQVERAFDEFFSTKKSGGGLGLALVKRVVDAHGGTVQLSSHLGEGTHVMMNFPLA